MNKWNPLQKAFDNSKFNPDLGHSGQSKKNARTELYISGIPPDFTESAFRNLFSKYGKVVHTKLLDPKNSGFRTRSGFIGYGSYYEAQEAIKNLNGCEIGQFVLHVSVAEPRKPRNQANFEELAEKLNVGRMIDADAHQLMKKTEENFLSNQQRFFPPTSKAESYLDNPLCSPVSDRSRSSGSNTPPRNYKTKTFINNASNLSHNHSRKSSILHDDFSGHSFKDVKKSPSPTVNKKNRNSRSHHNSFTNKTKSPCQVCGQETSTYCTSCKSTFYCSQDCQKKDWKVHKQTCKKMASEKSSEYNTSNSSSICLDETFCQKVAEDIFKSIKKTQVKPVISSFPSDIKKDMDLDLAVIDIDPKSAFLLCQNATTSSAKQLEKLQMNLNTYYNNEQGTVLSSVEIGDVCAALYSDDNQWYRAKIREFVDNDQVLIQFLDYGNCELTNKNGLMELEETFTKLPAFCLVCKLSGTNDVMSWTASQSEFLVDILQCNGMLLKAKCTRIVGEFFYGQFWSNGVSINDKMNRLTPIKASKMKSPQSVSRSFSPTKPDHSPLVLSAEKTHKYSPDRKHAKHKTTLRQVKIPEEVFDVFLSCIENPDSFYCQVVAEDFVKIHNYLPELNRYFSSDVNKVDYHPVVGEICAALYEEDQQWYRTKVMKILTSNLCKVFFVDFGNTADVSLQCVQPLPDQYHSLPMQAFKASLANCFPIHGRWSSKAIDFFKGLENSMCKAKAVKHSNRGDSNVSLILYINDNKSLNDEFVTRGMAISNFPSEESSSFVQKSADSDLMFCTSLKPFVPPSNRKCQIVISCLFKPGGFYCYVMNEHSMTMEQLSSNLSSQCSRLQPPPRSRLVPGAYCGAYFEKRRAWCRAVVVSVKESLIQVQSVDYGNTAWILDREIRLLPCEFEQPPKLALSCRLADVQPAEEKWDHEYTNTIFNVLDSSLDAMFIGKEGGEYVVKIPDITNKLIQQHIAYYCFELDN